MRIIRKAWFLKLCLLVLFVFFTGLPQSCWQLNKEENVKEKPTETIAERIAISKFISEKINNAKMKISSGEKYTSTEYFQDLKEINMQVKASGKRDYTPYYMINELFDLSWQSLKTKADSVALEIARKDYQNYIDPSGENRKESQAIFNSITWKIALTWLILIYFKIMPFAFAWLFSWLFERSEEEGKFFWPKPFRFLLMLVLYPIILPIFFIKFWRIKGREYLAETELRRTKDDLFGRLSEDELKKIKLFSQSKLTFSAWQQQIYALGLKPKHAFATAMAVALLLTFIPALTQAETKTKENFQHKIYLQQVIDQHAARISIENDQQDQQINHDWQDKLPAWSEEDDSIPVLTAWFLKIREKVFRFKNVYRQIDHVPIFSVIQCEVKVLNLITE